MRFAVFILLKIEIKKVENSACGFSPSLLSFKLNVLCHIKIIDDVKEHG